MMSAGMEMASLADVPHVLKVGLIAPYIDGLFFVHAARRKGGWAMATDKVWEQPPTTTEQILHFEKWEKHEEAIAVAVPTAAALGQGFTRDDEDTTGELGLMLTYEEWMPSVDARKVAADWGGDKTATFTRGERDRDDDPRALRRRREARGLREAPRRDEEEARASEIDSASTVCFERDALGPLIVSRKDRDLVIAAGPAMRGSPDWKSAATCAVAKKWADEVLSNR